jgi:hypothetical protein
MSYSFGMLKIQISDQSFLINQTPFQFPIPIADLKKILGEPREIQAKQNYVLTWDDLGLTAFSKDKRQVETSMMHYRASRYKFDPKSPFSGELTLNDEDAIAFRQNKKERTVKMFKGDDGGAAILNGISVWYDILVADSLETLLKNAIDSLQRGETEIFEFVIKNGSAS